MILQGIREVPSCCAVSTTHAILFSILLLSSGISNSFLTWFFDKIASELASAGYISYSVYSIGPQSRYSIFTALKIIAFDAHLFTNKQFKSPLNPTPVNISLICPILSAMSCMFMLGTVVKTRS